MDVPQHSESSATRDHPDCHPHNGTDTGTQASKISEDYIYDPKFSHTFQLLDIIQKKIIYDRTDTPLCELSIWSLRTLRTVSTFRRYVTSRRCRPANPDEWQQVEKHIIMLSKHLNDEQMKYVKGSYISSILLKRTTILLLCFSIITLITALIVGDSHSVLYTNVVVRSFFLLSFTCWLATTGALGAAAFIYVNALHIQVDPKVDITSHHLDVMRLILGALFAVILVIPGYQQFQEFAEALFSYDHTKIQFYYSLLLLLPFLLGFSTPLVLNILGRFILSARTFFGLALDQDGDSKPGISRGDQIPRGLSPNAAPPNTDHETAALVSR
jgi:hypothetical protein